ncbi:MAG: L-seryl-tRNA(Sec) selenium transferase [Chthonomonas sp.]|nr:L-seryl-tRNA(Sec) selenium transferase [Chthonomonas sp.]
MISKPRPPSVDRLLRLEGLECFSFAVRRQAARTVQAALRRQTGDPAELMRAECAKLMGSGVATVINATGVVLHTGLGRARVSEEAAAAMARVAAEHAAVEFDLATGERGDRQSLVRDQLCQLTGAEDALVVNNCAGATLLTLAALAVGREVILSRGQMVEIGGEFRMPDVIRASGCQLVEVGCTNRTHLRDYQQALSESTGAILRCHPSNYWIGGFTSEVPLSEMASLGVPVIDDMGSGNVVDTQRHGLPAERTMRHSLEQGAALVLASGDKLLGGPQAGIIAGRADLIATIRRHPLARALRIDKVALAGLRVTLDQHLRGELAVIPTWAAILASPQDIKRRCQAVARGLPQVEVMATESEIGGGSFPGMKLPSFAVVAPGELLPPLRMWRTSVIGRMERGKVLLDLRTCTDAEAKVVRQALGELLAKQ